MLNMCTSLLNQCKNVLQQNLSLILITTEKVEETQEKLCFYFLMSRIYSTCATLGDAGVRITAL